MEYKGTLNMPQTSFEMKANLPQREPEMLRRWADMDLYQTVQAHSQGRPKWVLHDGPPYANGDIHVGHAMNKILKDIVVKSVTAFGYDSPYVPGWDTHGLPIEMKALAEFKLDRKKIDPVELRRKCAEFALKYRDAQREQFQRLGVRGDWEHPYITLDPAYEAKQIEVFAAMALKGHIYRGLKPVYWCPEDETALAEAEIEYADKTSHSIYVRFPVSDTQGKLPEGSDLVIWTTTPWTLPGNLAICLHPDAEYGLYETEQGALVLARELAPRVAEACGLTLQNELQTFRGRDLEGVICRHPLFDRDSLVILGEHVTIEDGTGCVHTAPGHGHEDFEVGQKYGLEPLNPVDDRGVFTNQGGKYAGQYYDKANKAIIADLEEAGALLKHVPIQHSYAHCWRCKNPVIYRATVQWFASVDGFRREALKAIDEVQWVPEWGIDRIRNMVADRGDWCISRQRLWGMPIPIMSCRDCGDPLIHDEAFRAVADHFRRDGSEVWWTKSEAELLPAGLACARCGSREFRKEPHTMDVWFDSGSSHAAVCEVRDNLHWPADMYLEGSDQHRGWFQSSLLTATAYKGRAPYRTVLTHGFVVDEQGRKMSKSLGNVVNPLEVCKQYGADVLRLWVAASDYRGDLACSQGILKQVAEVYRKIRNTFRFLLGNLYDFDPAVDAVGKADLEPVDRWAMHRLQEVVRKARDSFRDYEFHAVYHEINRFITGDLSSVYLDVTKDRLYCALPASRERRAAQTVMYRLADTLMRILMPILAFTTEEVYQHLPKTAGAPVTVQLLPMPEIDADYVDEELGQDFAELMEVRTGVYQGIEQARAAKAIGKSEEAKVHLYVTGDHLAGLLEKYGGELPGLLKVSQVRIYSGGAQEAPSGTFFAEGPSGLKITVEKADGEQCERCLFFKPQGHAKEHPHLCERCTQVVLSLQAGNQG